MELILNLKGLAIRDDSDNPEPKIAYIEANGEGVITAADIKCSSDIEIINTELILADIQTIENRLPKLQKEAKSKLALKPTVDYLNKLFVQLQSGQPLSSIENLNFDLISDLHLLTAKPVIYAFNVDETTLTDSSKQDKLAELVSPAKSIFVCAKLEEELKGLDETESKELLESYGVSETGLSQMINSAYSILGLQSYMTAGPKEIHAWTIHKGWTAPQAAGVIHTDFERGFIAAQIVDFKDLDKFGSEQSAKQAGKIRTEGRDYIMQPNDVVEFRFNV